MVFVQLLSHYFGFPSEVLGSEVNSRVDSKTVEKLILKKKGMNGSSKHFPGSR